jgi:hypothetical protein
MTSMPRAFLIAAAALLAASPGSALDGGGFAAEEPGLSYYEIAVDELAVTSSETTSSELTKDGAASGGLPTSLYVVDAEGGVTYSALGDGAWEVAVAVAERPHERVDAVYDLVLALPLPLGSQAKAWRIEPKASVASSASIVYGGESIVLKRNVPLEQAWLPLLSGAPGGLPDLSRSGYAWTFWDAIVRYDPSVGATVQAYGTFRYQADPRVVAPDAENPDNAAYVITWIPTLEAVPPFAIRLDVVGGEE